jgi:hypothetical protein
MHELQHLLAPAMEQRLSRRLAALHQKTPVNIAAGDAAAAIAQLGSRRLLRKSSTDMEAPEVIGASAAWRSSRLPSRQNTQQQRSSSNGATIEAPTLATGPDSSRSSSSSSSSLQSSRIRSLVNGASSTSDSGGSTGGLNTFGAPALLPMDMTSVSAGAASPTAVGVNGTGPTTRNPWYDQHVLSGPAGSPQGLLYQRLNTSSSAPLSADDAELDVIGSEFDPADSVVPDPPPYEYPPVGRYPTVFFTAVLQGYNHPSGLGPAEQVGHLKQGLVCCRLQKHALVAAVGAESSAALAVWAKLRALHALQRQQLVAFVHAGSSIHAVQHLLAGTCQTHLVLLFADSAGCCASAAGPGVSSCSCRLLSQQRSTPSSHLHQT